MKELSQKNLTKSETLLLSSYRKLNHYLNVILRKANSLFRQKLIKIFLLIFVFLLISIIFFIVYKSKSYKKEGKLLYENIKYEQALEKYYEAKKWWLFEKIFSRFNDKDLDNKIRKAKVMVRSSEFYSQGIEAYEEERYGSAKWYLNNLAENDPRNEEAKRILTKIEEALSVKPTSSPTPIQLKPLTLALIPTPTLPSIPENKPSYVYDPYYPIILSLSDNRGGQIKYSSYNQYPYSSQDTSITLKVGDNIRWEAVASEPMGRQILYQFHSNSQRQIDTFGRGQYKTENWFEYTITEEDIKSAGETLRIVLEIRSEKENYRTGESGSDDTTYLDYKLQPNP